MTDINKRKLFCQLSPFTFKISKCKEMLRRFVKDIFKGKFAKEKNATQLPYLIISHNSLIRRKLGNVDQTLQENKANNLQLTVPKVSGILIKPGEEFSFWQLVGKCSKKKGYKEGLTINSGKVGKGIGGGMCQFTNLIHWMVLHTPLTITEYHHHDGYDLFPDFGRTVPFGTGTSIMYNYLDYRFINKTDSVFQIIVYTTKEYLCGEIRSNKEQAEKYHIVVEDEYFTKEGDTFYRNGKVFRTCIDKKTGNMLSKECIKTNHAKVLYDEKFIKQYVKQ